MTPEQIAATWAENAGGLVLSGGEPFSQAMGLTRLCDLVREQRPDTPILVYSGYRLEELVRACRRDWAALLRVVDVLVDGPYIQERRTDFALAGSDNQRVFLLGSRLRLRLDEASAAEIQMSLAPDGQLRLVGAGAADLDMHDLVKRLLAQGLVLEP